MTSDYGTAAMPDPLFADYLRSLPRERPEGETVQQERQHDAEVGPWVGNQTVHHVYGESRQS